MKIYKKFTVLSILVINSSYITASLEKTHKIKSKQDMVAQIIVASARFLPHTACKLVDKTFPPYEKSIYAKIANN